MPRPNIAHYERSRSRPRRPRIDPAALASDVGVPNAPEFRRLVGQAEKALDAYHAARYAAKDEAGELLAGVRVLRDKLDEARGFYRRLARAGILDQMMIEESGVLKRFESLDAQLTSAVETCGAVLAARWSLEDDPDVMALLKALHPRHARRRLAERLARAFQEYSATREWPSNWAYEVRLKAFVREIFRTRAITWSDERTVWQRLVPKALRRLSPK
jgi:hypothetical protein